jgi:ABC-type glycerol-3-phosphate transport system substrate-binding protein
MSRRTARLGWLALLLVALVMVARAVNLRLVRFTTRTSAARAATNVRLDYVCWGDRAEQSLNKHWMAEFERLHPDIQVNIIDTTGGEGTEIKIQTMIAGGSPPDVMYVWPEVFPTFGRKGI